MSTDRKANQDQKSRQASKETPRGFSVVAHLGKFVLGIGWRAHRGFFSLLLVGNIFNGIFSFTNVYLRAKIISDAALLAHSSSTEIDPTLINQFFRGLAFLAALSLSSSLLTLILNTVQTLYQNIVAQAVQTKILGVAADTEMSHLDDSEFLNKLHHIVSESSAKPFAVLQLLFDVISSGIFILVLSLTVATWHSWLIALLAIPLALQFWINATLAPARFASKLKRTEATRKANYFRSILSNVKAAKDIKLFGLSEYFQSQLQKTWSDSYFETRKFIIFRVWRRAVAVVLVSLSQPLVYGFAGWQLIHRSLTFRGFTLYTQSIYQLYSRLNALSLSVVQFREHMLSLKHLNDFLSAQVKAKPPRIGARPNSGRPILEFRNVSFSFPDANRPVINNVSFTVEEGQTLAIVGDNGSGKSTILNLASGLYTPSYGQILWRGIDRNNINPSEWLDQISVMTQDFTLFHISAGENIGVGDVRRLNDTEGIKAAARLVGLDRLIETWPDGYDTPLSRQFRRGRNLSHGQQQLFALARSVFRKAQLLLMDEPTAALDVNSEADFFKNFIQNANRAFQSIILVCHKLSIARHATLICVMRDGEMIEKGTHVQLMARDKVYARLYDLQCSLDQIN